MDTREGGGHKIHKVLSRATSPDGWSPTLSTNSLERGGILLENASICGCARARACVCVCVDSFNHHLGWNWIVCHFCSLSLPWVLCLYLIFHTEETCTFLKRVLNLIISPKSSLFLAKSPCKDFLSIFILIVAYYGQTLISGKCTYNLWLSEF